MKTLAALSVAALIALSSSAAFAGDKKGTFTGANDHVVTGGVTVTESDDTITIKLGSNFDLDGAPDPYVSLANGTKKPIENVGFLKKHKGASTFSIKKTSALSSASHVLIWCKKFGVTLGHAKIN